MTVTIELILITEDMWDAAHSRVWIHQRACINNSKKLKQLT